MRRRREREKNLDRELRYHLDRRAEDLMKSGMSAPEARRQAAIEFGGLAQVQEDVRDTWILRWLKDLARDTRYAGRTLLHTPGFTATAAPIVIFHGDADENVPIADSATLLTRLCAAGQVVERRVLPGVDHGIAARDGFRDGVAWLVGLAGGAPPASSC